MQVFSKWEDFYSWLNRILPKFSDRPLLMYYTLRTEMTSRNLLSVGDSVRLGELASLITRWQIHGVEHAIRRTLRVFQHSNELTAQGDGDPHFPYQVQGRYHGNSAGRHMPARAVGRFLDVHPTDLSFAGERAGRPRPNRCADDGGGPSAVAAAGVYRVPWANAILENTHGPIPHDQLRLGDLG